MPTLKAIVANMLAKDGTDALGRVVGISSLTTTTVVCSALAYGTASSQKFVKDYLWRPDTATAADRYRMCSAHTSSSGTLTHAGTNYADTTATSENVYILKHEPQFYIDAINEALLRTRYSTRAEVTAVADGWRHPVLHSFITKPSDIEAVYWVSSPMLVLNSDFSMWGALQSTGGTLAPDQWSLSGSGATMARTAATYRTGPYAVTLTRASNNVTLRQTIPLLHSGVDGNSLLGQTVMIVGVGQTSTASHLRFTVTAGGTSGSTSYHTGGGFWEELSTSITVPSANANTITIDAEVNTTDAAATIDRLYAVRGTSTVTDAMRRNDYTMVRLGKEEWGLDQLTGGWRLLHDAPGQGQYVLLASRAYPAFDTTRILAGSADADSTDCPLDVVTLGALHSLYRSLSRRPGEDFSRYRMMAEEYRRKWQRAAASHRLTVDDRDGVDVPAPRLMATTAVY